MHALHQRFNSYFTILALGIGLAHLSACSRSEEPPAPQSAPAPQAGAFRVTRVDLGNAIGADKKVTAPQTSFKPKDTIYASVASEGASPGTSLSARWSFEDGQMVSESTQKIAPTGSAATEFHISKPDGWPVGKYKLEILADGKPAGGAQFTVSD